MNSNSELLWFHMKQLWMMGRVQFHLSSWQVLWSGVWRCRQIPSWTWDLFIFLLGLPRFHVRWWNDCKGGADTFSTRLLHQWDGIKKWKLPAFSHSTAIPRLASHIKRFLVIPTKLQKPQQKVSNCTFEDRRQNTQLKETPLKLVASHGLVCMGIRARLNSWQI